MPDATARAWRGLGIAAAGLVTLAGLTLALIAAGTFDPRPFGRLLRTDHPGRHDVPGDAVIVPQSPPWTADQRPGRYSLRLTAAHVAGNPDSGYGLALGDGVNRLVAAVSPLGYVAIWQEGNGPPAYYMPWQTWPHVRPGPEEHEIWLDVENIAGRAALTVWVNREQLWQGTIEPAWDGVELWLGSFGGPTGVDFGRLEWFAAPRR
jgi:hypothetical protein